LDAVGGFDHSIITEDIEMSVRILAHGYKTRYAHDAVVYTEGPSDLGGLSKQRLRWKYGRLLTFMKYKNLFFNLKTGNLYFTSLILPVAVLAEVCLLLEPLLIAAFFGFSIVTGDYMPLVATITSMTILTLVQISCDSKAKFHRNVIVLAPIAWLLSYIIDAVEYRALCLSIKKLVKRQKLEWQVWTRVGIADSNMSANKSNVTDIKEAVNIKRAA
jgi:cellulose synthase/poly-beta-1,6-N-acetylglucosamine synthase-like glycosyltransferase